MSTVQMNKNIKSLNLREKDPFLSREKQRYEHPLPSREWIIELLERKGVPKSNAGAAELSITEDEYVFFERRLKRDGAGWSGFNQPSGRGLRGGTPDLVKCRVEAQATVLASPYRSCRRAKRFSFIRTPGACVVSCTATLLPSALSA